MAEEGAGGMLGVGEEESYGLGEHSEGGSGKVHEAEATSSFLPTCLATPP